MQRHDSNSSINSYQETFKRNASRNLSHFGTQAQTAGYISLQIGSNMMAAKGIDSDSKIESPRNKSNLSAFNPKPQDARGDKKQTTQIMMDPHNQANPHQQYSNLQQLQLQQQQQQQQQNQYEDYYQYDIEQDFDAMKEFVIYYPQNNLSQVLRQIRKNWLDKFSKKRFKTKGSYKTTQKSKSNLNNLTKLFKKADTKNTYKTNQPILKSDTKGTQNFTQSFYN